MPIAGGLEASYRSELAGAPNLAAMVGGEFEPQGAGGGWAEVLSDLKTLLETGKALRA